MLFGALNWSHVWYRPGSDPPPAVARHFIDALKYQLELPTEAARATGTT
jgi:hypothetical protein